MNASKTASPATSVDLSMCKEGIELCRHDIGSVLTLIAKFFIHCLAVSLESGTVIILFVDFSFSMQLTMLNAQGLTSVSAIVCTS
jgi:hypothetical protein